MRAASSILAVVLGACSGGGEPAIPVEPASRFIDWDPGVRGGIPPLDEACPAGAPSVTDFGASGDGTTDDHFAFAAAIEAAEEGGAIRVPAGTYLLRSGILVDRGIVLCGEGPDTSRLHFETDDIAIDIVTYDRGDWTRVSGGHTQGSTSLVVRDASGFVAGGYAELKQTNDWSVMDPEGEWRNASWVPEDSVGQMLRVVRVEGDVLTVEPPLCIDYDAGQRPEIRPLGLVAGAGLQGLYMRRLDTNDQPTVEIKNAVNAWMRDCESEDTSRAHVSTSSVLWCEIRDSYMHDAHDHGGGGHGYGASLGSHTTACLVENNVFVRLRHSMIIQVGASGNVFGYNYSTDPYQSEGGDWTPCDISLHGHYPSMNLFESNTVQEIDVADYWGACGPGNTFLRNRTEAEGIQVMDHSHFQNIIGNELTSAPNDISTDDTVTGTLIHGNRVDGAVSWDPAIAEREIPASYYLDSKPGFLGDADWPLLGADLEPGSGILPAEERYLGM